MTPSDHDGSPAALSIDRLLGPIHRDEPSTAELVQTVEQELLGAAEATAEYLRAHPHVEGAIRAGLESLTHNAPADLGDPRRATSVTISNLRIPLPPLRAAAATEEQKSPFPRDRRVVWDDGHGSRLSYFRTDAQAYFGLFAADPFRAELIRCVVDGQPSPIEESGPGQMVASLGQPAALIGKQVDLLLDYDEEELPLCYHLSEETGAR
jgi:hypothetical protein